MPRGRMLGRADFEYLTENVPVEAPDGPLPGLGDVGVTPGTEEFRLRFEQWLNEQGIDHDALMEWCLEQSLEDVNEWQIMVLAGVNPTVLLGSMLATAYTLGIQMGWRLHQRQVG